jgi:hypothetical protein
MTSPKNNKVKSFNTNMFEKELMLTMQYETNVNPSGRTSDDIKSNSACNTKMSTQ